MGNSVDGYEIQYLKQTGVKIKEALKVIDIDCSNMSRFQIEDLINELVTRRIISMENGLYILQQ